MKIGYGRNRKEAAFRRHGVDPRFVFIDTEASERTERGAMLQSAKVALERGDKVTLVLLAKSDLGYGLDLVRQREKLEALGVMTIVPTEKPKGPRGRPVGTGNWAPTEEQDAKYRAAWHDNDRTKTGCFNMARRDGWETTESMWKHRYGNRFKGKGDT